MLHAGIKVDMQILGGIVVIHIIGHVEIDAPDGVHQLDEAVDAHLDITVNRRTDDVSGGFHHAFYARSGIDAADLLRFIVLFIGIHIGAGITGNAQYVEYAFVCVKAADHDGIRIAIALVTAQEEDIVIILHPLPDLRSRFFRGFRCRLRDPGGGAAGPNGRRRCGVCRG